MADTPLASAAIAAHLIHPDDDVAVTVSAVPAAPKKGKTIEAGRRLPRVAPPRGNGTLVVQLVRTDPSSALAASAATASWSTDPFVLGPWTTTAAFPWAP